MSRVAMFPAEIREGDRFVWKGRTEWVAMSDAETWNDATGVGVTCLVKRRDGRIIERRWRSDERILIDRSQAIRRIPVH